ncbi:MAG: hypothetical protein HYY02_03450 [Chloroflexi bacterium]|nr:hypothetical protein [Chloroflexota bacterium]
MRRSLAPAGVLIALILGTAACATFQPEAAPGRSAATPGATVTPAVRRADPAAGRYLATIGLCLYCHTAEGGQPAAGGRILAAPGQGRLVAGNLTPDKSTGLGDFAEARRLLKEAGYEKGLTLKMMHSSDRAGSANGYAEVALIIQQQFARDFPKIKIEPDGILWAEQNRRNVERNYEVSWWGFVYETEPGIQLHNAYHTEGGRNYTGWSDAKFDSMWERQQWTTDMEERKKLLKELQRYILDQYVLVQGYEYFNAALIHPTFKGYEEWGGSGNGPGGTLRYIENMWFDK